MSITQKKTFFTNNLKAAFTNKQISTNVTYTYVQDFKDIIGFRRFLEKHLGQYESLRDPMQDVRYVAVEGTTKNEKARKIMPKYRD